MALKIKRYNRILGKKLALQLLPLNYQVTPTEETGGALCILPEMCCA